MHPQGDRLQVSLATAALAQNVFLETARSVWLILYPGDDLEHNHKTIGWTALRAC